jgi:hypothetical protein
MDQLLLQLGLGVASNAIYDFLKSYFQNTAPFTKETLKVDLASFLHVQGADIKAEKIIEFLAQNGDIKIEGSTIFAANSITMFSQKGTNLVFGNESTSSTEKTKIDTGKGAFIQAQGGAGIKQNEDGSISFYV